MNWLNDGPFAETIIPLKKKKKKSIASWDNTMLFIQSLLLLK